MSHDTHSAPVLKYNEALPVWQHKDAICEAVLKHDIVLIIGHTGSGKTTQIPQYLMDLYDRMNNNQMIVCTQPRRVAVTSVAARVVKEQQQYQNRHNETIGQRIGYQIQLERKIDKNYTKLVFMTEGILLRSVKGNGTVEGQSANLNRYSVIIIDEAHERTIDCDLLMAFLKTKLARKNKD